MFMVKNPLPSAKYWHGKNSFRFEDASAECARPSILPFKSYEN
jgi:hypothetical protein